MSELTILSDFSEATASAMCMQQDYSIIAHAVNCNKSNYNQYWS